MKFPNASLSFVRTVFASILSSTTVAAADEPRDLDSSVSANVGPLRTTQGSVACRLYKSGDGFPRTTKGTVTVRVKVAGKSTRCAFEKLPPGTYAVMVHHDENDNGKFDKNLLGIPLEGYGVSNNHTHALSAPSWEESKFVIERGKPRTLAISLRY